MASNLFNNYMQRMQGGIPNFQQGGAPPPPPPTQPPPQQYAKGDNPLSPEQMRGVMNGMPNQGQLLFDPRMLDENPSAMMVGGGFNPGGNAAQNGTPPWLRSMILEGLPPPGQDTQAAGGGLPPPPPIDPAVQARLNQPVGRPGNMPLPRPPQGGGYGPVGRPPPPGPQMTGGPQMGGGQRGRVLADILGR